VIDASKGNGTKESREFDSEKAEFFEALGHPTRIKLLEALAEGPHSFSELKKRLDIESSGNLSFHLGKLETLVKTNADGNYVLTDDGKEAVRVIEATVGTGNIRMNATSHSGMNVTAIAVSIVWAFTMLAISIFVGRDTTTGTAVLEILIFGFIANLLIVTGVGQRRVSKRKL
jgi:DNA-binding transcriptional ArsR family regulator